MLNPRQRPMLLAVIALVLIWVVAVAGYKLVQHATVTPETVRAYTASLDFNLLSAADRATALAKLAAMLNALSLEDRQKLRLERTASRWFEQMTEAEKAEFLEATMPTGFKQMLAAFEDMPADKRQRILDQALKQMKEARGKLPPAGAKGPGWSPDLQEKVTKLGLKSFYSQSSAQTKAELAPLLEEMQRAMESGRMMHGQ